MPKRLPPIAKQLNAIRREVDERPMYFNKELEPIDVFEWSRLWGDWSYRCIADEMVGEPPVRVATIWEGIDHWFGESPEVFESMVFGGPLDKECVRYARLVDAELGHRLLVERVKAHQLIRRERNQ